MITEIDNKTATKLLLKGWSCDICRTRKDVFKRTGWHCSFLKHRPKMNVCSRVKKSEQYDDNTTFITSPPIEFSLDDDGEVKEKIDIQNA